MLAAPVALRCVPSPHSATALAPAPHQPPASHASHAVAFGDGWYSPGSHGEHSLARNALLKLPGLHSLACVAPRAHAEPSGHAVHAPSHVPPGSLRYVPASHSVTELEPAPHQPPVSHGSQPVRPLSGWYSPAGHALQLLAFAAAPRWPGAQSIGAVERARQ